LRDADLLEAGYRVIRATRQLANDPGSIAARLKRLLAAVA